MASTPIVIRYPEDRTGVSPNNRVVDEEHTMVRRPVRAVAPYYGPFFADSMVIREMTTQTLLVRNVDYQIAYTYEIPTAKFGKNICAIVLITNQNVADTIQLTYQTVGGQYSSSVDAIVQMINSLDMDDRPVKWENIIGKPSEFDPAPHLHDIGDIYGFEYLVEACEGIRRAILMGDVATHDEIYRYIDAAIASLGNNMDALRDALIAHVNNFNNPHQTTPGQIGTYTSAQIDALIAASVATARIRVIDVASGTTLSDRNTYANTWIRVTGIPNGGVGALSIPANVFQKDDVIMFNTQGGQCQILSAGGLAVRWPYQRNNVVPGPSGSAGIIFASPSVCDMVGDTQLL